MDFKTLLAEKLGRDTAFPVYPQLIDVDKIREGPESDIRVILAGHVSEDIVRDDFIQYEVRKSDVVSVRLYEGVNSRSGPGTSARAPCYDANIRALEALAGRCHAVIIANAHPEFTFKCPVAWNSDDVGRRRASELAANFVYETSSLVKKIGGHKVWYLLQTWDTCIDCYYGGSLVRDAVNQQSDALYTCCAYSMFGGHCPEGEPGSPVPQSVPEWCPYHEQPPQPVLSEYIRQAEWYTGVGMVEGLVAGNDSLLKMHGFSAGIVGSF